MEDETLIWFQDAEETGQFTSWEGFVRALHTRFGALAYDDLMEALTKLRQVSSVSNYKAQFEALSNRIKELFEKHKLSCFLSGLKDEMRFLLRCSIHKLLILLSDLQKYKRNIYLVTRELLNHG